ncbi:hypothetical protein BDV23DRAFT_146431 [Aspergillus alliaceus]|uniref:Uncharacterized protein n=1 Tax=Petromyces alliaceus TaxID=209559 RepID=A0A5N7CKQ3_PETAA|nr:hypothetical protein BDV23DRAFT_146431 [Aspergillus alliaceus]
MLSIVRIREVADSQMLAWGASLVTINDTTLVALRHWGWNVTQHLLTIARGVVK